jgi:CelD/BcsL family acetyltransferase involved in cellulose biosynthesis
VIPAYVSPDNITVTISSNFADIDVSEGKWNEVAARGDTWTVFQELTWLKSWWACFGRGKLLVCCAWVDSEIVAIAPIFIDSGMAFFVGSGGSDYLDFIGNVGQQGVVVAILQSILRSSHQLLGFRFYLVPNVSRTGAILRGAASELGLVCYEEGSLVAPAIELSNLHTAIHYANKPKLVQYERRLRREGLVLVRQLKARDEMTSLLPQFFSQHIERWKDTEFPSLFLDSTQRAFFENLVLEQPAWLRFALIEWKSRPIAFHFGFCHRGVFSYYKPTFDVKAANRSPGLVLLRQLLLQSNEEQVRIFDLGLGEEPYKRRFSNCLREVRTWGLYPVVSRSE